MQDADALDRIVMHFADVYEQLTDHLKKLGQPQRQLDALVQPKIDHEAGTAPARAGRDSRRSRD